MRSSGNVVFKKTAAVIIRNVKKKVKYLQEIRTWRKKMKKKLKICLKYLFFKLEKEIHLKKNVQNFGC